MMRTGRIGQRIQMLRRLGVADTLLPQDYLIVYRGLSDQQYSSAKSEGLKPSPDQDAVYTTIYFSRASAFAYGHTKVEGGSPIVFKLKVPAERFQSQIAYKILGRWQPVGFLKSGPLEPALIQQIIVIPQDDRRYCVLADEEDAEADARRADTERILALIPVEKVEV